MVPVPARRRHLGAGASAADHAHYLVDATGAGGSRDEAALGVLYIALTIAYHVPLNEALHRVDPTSLFSLTLRADSPAARRT